MTPTHNNILNYYFTYVYFSDPHFRHLKYIVEKHETKDGQKRSVEHCSRILELTYFSIPGIAMTKWRCGRVILALAYSTEDRFFEFKPEHD